MNRPLRSCALCERGALADWVIHESDHWRVVVNRNQNLLGKVMIVLHRHEESVALLTQAEWADLQGQIQWTVTGLTRAFAPDHFNHVFLQNQDRHVHLHVIPRYAGQREFLGARFVDPGYPGHYGLGDERIVESDFAQRIAGALGDR